MKLGEDEGKSAEEQIEASLKSTSMERKRPTRFLELTMYSSVVVVAPRNLVIYGFFLICIVDRREEFFGINVTAKVVIRGVCLRVLVS
jgi:hypothetical protein